MTPVYRMRQFAHYHHRYDYKGMNIQQDIQILEKDWKR